HDGAISSGHRVGGTTKWLVRLKESQESRMHSPTDAEATAVTAQVTLPHPAHITFQLVDRIEAPSLDQARCQAHCHRGVIRPLPGCQVERAASHHLFAEKGGSIAMWRPFKGGTE